MVATYPIYAFDEFTLDTGRGSLKRGDREIRLRPKAYTALRYLIENNGRLVTKDELVNVIWPDTAVTDNSLVHCLKEVREALGDRSQKYIRTVPRRGYIFEERVAMSENGRARETLAESESSSRGKEDRIPRPVFKKMTIGSAVVAVALAGVAVWLTLMNFVNGPTVPFSSFSVKRFSDNGSFGRAVISSNGRLLAYTDNKSAVWLKNTASDSSVRIINEPDAGDAHQVIAFSPDDNYIYLFFSPQGGRGELSKVALFGNVARQKLAEDIWSLSTLSPDGSEAAFIRYDPADKSFWLVAARTDSGGERVIAKSGDNERFETWIQATAWSPDSNRIACVGRSQADDNVERFITIRRADDGSEIDRIKAEPSMHSINAVAWLPDDDNLLVIASDHSLLGQIYRYRISKGSWQRITNDLSDYQNLSVTGDGKTVVSTIFNNEANLWVLPDADAARARQITHGFNTILDSTGISWAPDGRIVYATNAGGEWEIRSINPDGSGSKQLTDDCAGNDTCGMPFVSPDNRYIVFQASRNGLRNIWRMGSDGSDPIQLTTAGGILPFVTEDSKYVIYINRTLNTSTLWQVPIEGGEQRRVTDMNMISITSFSPGGKLMAFGYYDPESKLPWQMCVSVVGAPKPEKCFGKGGRAFPRWAADGTAFYTLASDYSAIWKQSVDGRRQMFLEFPGERIGNFAFSPSGKDLVVARSKPTQTIIALSDGQ